MGTCGDALKVSYGCSSFMNMEFCLRLILNHINLTWGLWVTKFFSKVEFVADQPGLVESLSVQSNCALQSQLSGSSSNWRLHLVSFTGEQRLSAYAISYAFFDGACTSVLLRIVCKFVVINPSDRDFMQFKFFTV